MPDLNGLQLYQRLKGINADTKVLFLTALDLASELTSVLPNVKRDEILKKPVDREHFVNIVKANL